MPVRLLTVFKKRQRFSLKFPGWNYATSLLIHAAALLGLGLTVMTPARFDVESMLEADRQQEQSIQISWMPKSRHPVAQKVEPATPPTKTETRTTTKLTEHPVPPQKEAPTPEAIVETQPSSIPESPPAPEVQESKQKAAATVKAKPRYLRNPPPHYPRSARKRGIEGRVLLSVTVGATGRPEAVSINQSSGYKPLDQSARKAILGWRFSPATLGGVPRRSVVLIPIEYKLK